MSSDLRQIGVITRPHGLKGEVKVRPETDDPSRLEALEYVLLGSGETNPAPYRLIGVRYQAMRSGPAIVLALEGVASRDDAEELAGLAVWAEEDALPPLDDDEVYLSDLVGLEVWDGSDRKAGVVTDVLDLPAQPVLVVLRETGDEVLVPFVHDLVDSVDSERIVVRPVEGLLDPERSEEVA